MSYSQTTDRSETAGAGGSQASRPLVMVCLSPSPSCRRVIRAAARMAFCGLYRPDSQVPVSAPVSADPAFVPDSQASDSAVHASAPDPAVPASAPDAAFPDPGDGRPSGSAIFTPIALYVGSTGREAGEDSLLQENIRFARDSGFEVHTVQGSDIPLAISEYARREKVTDLFLGYSPPSFFLQTKPAINEKLLSYLPTVDIHIIPDPVSSPYAKAIRQKAPDGPVWNLQDLVLMLGVMTVATLLSAAFYVSRYSNSNIITIYILGVLTASVMTSSRVYGILAAVLYVLLFNFLFIEPRFTLLVYDSSYLVTYLVTVIAALITGTVAVRLKNIARVSAENAYQAKVLLDTSNQLEGAADSQGIIRTTCMQLVHLLSRAVIFYPASDPETAPDRLADQALIFPSGEKTIPRSTLDRELEAVRWSIQNSHQAGAFTSHYEGCQCRYLSVFSGAKKYGVIGINMEGHPFTEFENTILLSIVHEGTMALENKRIIQEQKKAEVRAENERLRAGLLRSISHDLRTPLTSIHGNAFNLRFHEQELTAGVRRKIYDDILEDSDWLIAQFENILSMTRLESGIGIRKTVEDLEDVIEESLTHLSAHPRHPICFRKEECRDQICFARIDPRLIMQVLINLLGNAVKYTPADSRIEIRLRRSRDRLTVEVADNGPGIPDPDKPHIFELFYTGSKAPADSSRSMGIGLNLCAQILRAHGGGIEVHDNTPSGAVFSFWLPAVDIPREDWEDCTERILYE